MLNLQLSQLIEKNHKVYITSKTYTHNTHIYKHISVIFILQKYCVEEIKHFFSMACKLKLMTVSKMTYNDDTIKN